MHCLETFVNAQRYVKRSSLFRNNDSSVAYVACAHVSQNVRISDIMSKLRYIKSLHSYKFRAHVLLTIRNALETRVNDSRHSREEKYFLFQLYIYVATCTQWCCFADINQQCKAHTAYFKQETNYITFWFNLYNTQRNM